MTTHHPKPGSCLTQRERDILVMIGEGKSSKQIGRALGISDLTVDSFVRNILNRLGVSTRVEAAVWAAKQGWLSEAKPEDSDVRTIVEALGRIDGRLRSAA